MPKLLPNLRDELLQQASQILREEGYTALSIRSLANRCHVATGTIYNYFDSKDAIVAQIMMVDWQTAIALLDEIAQRAADLTNGMVEMYHALSKFVAKYRATWTQFAQSGGSSNPILSYHITLRNQITQPITQLIQRVSDVSILSLSPLLAETLLANVMQPDLDEHPLRILMQRLSIQPPINQQEESTHEQL